MKAPNGHGQKAGGARKSGLCPEFRNGGNADRWREIARVPSCVLGGPIAQARANGRNRVENCNPSSLTGYCRSEELP
jgi:hypothetical protein